MSQSSWSFQPSFAPKYKKGTVDDDEENDEKDEKGGGADELLRDFQYALKCQFMERARNLRASCLILSLFLYFPHIEFILIRLPFAQLNMTLFCCPVLLPTRSAAQWSASCRRRCMATGLLFKRCFYAVQTTKPTRFWSPSSSRTGISLVSACCNVQTCWKFREMPMEPKGASPGCRS